MAQGDKLTSLMYPHSIESEFKKLKKRVDRQASRTTRDTDTTGSDGSAGGGGGGPKGVGGSPQTPVPGPDDIIITNSDQFTGDGAFFNGLLIDVSEHIKRTRGFMGYRVRITNDVTGETRESVVNAPEPGVATISPINVSNMNIADTAGFNALVQIQVRSSILGDGSWSPPVPIAINSDITPPGGVVGLTVLQDRFNTVHTYWNPCADLDFSHSIVKLNYAATFRIAGATKATHMDVQVDPKTEASPYSIQVQHVDKSGNAGAFCTAVSFSIRGIETNEIKDDAITAPKIIAGAVGTSEIANDAVTAAQIAAGAVGSSEIAALAVISGKIDAGAVGTTELASSAVTNAKIAASAVDTTQIATNAVTNTKIAASAVDTTQLAASAVTNAKLASNSVDSAQLVALAVKAGKIDTGAVGTTELAANAVTTAKIAAGAVGNTQLGTITDSTKFVPNVETGASYWNDAAGNHVGEAVYENLILPSFFQLRALGGNSSDLGTIRGILLSGNAGDDSGVAIDYLNGISLRAALSAVASTVVSSTTMNAGKPVCFIDASSANIVLTLPSTGWFSYPIVFIYRTDTSTHTATIAPSGGDTIDGTTTAMPILTHGCIVLIRNPYGNWQPNGADVYWDGSNWLSKREFETGHWSYYPGATPGVELSAAGTTEWAWWRRPKDGSGNLVKVTRYSTSAYINGSADGSNYWTLRLRTFTGTSTMSSVDFQTGTTWLDPSDVTTFSAQPSSSDLGLEIVAIKTGSPGPLRFTWTVKYRLILG